MSSQRPLSPHLQVYRWQITMLMSILHRASGIILVVGAFALAWWMLAVAAGGEAYASAAACVASPFGKFVLFGFSLAMVYHLLNGIRHLLWDAGWGFEIPEVYRSGYTVFALTVVLTLAIWFVALRGWRMSDPQPTSKPVRIAPDYRTPVGRARGLGSGKSGTAHFWRQRVTAIALVLLVPWLIGTLVSFVGADLATVHATLARPFNAIAFAVFALAMFWHAKLGVQVVIEDYVHVRALEIALQLLVTFACVLGAFASLYAIARIALLS